MSERRQREARREEAAAAGLRELLGQLLGAPQAEPTPQDIITGVDAQRLFEYVLGDRPRPATEEETEAELMRIREEMEKTTTLSRSMIEVFLSDGLLRLMHPAYSRQTINARIRVIAAELVESIRRKFEEALRAMKSGEPEDIVKAKIQEAYETARKAKATLILLYDYLLQLYFVNSPAEARPPLANVILGYDMLRGGKKPR